MQDKDKAFVCAVDRERQNLMAISLIIISWVPTQPFLALADKKAKGRDINNKRAIGSPAKKLKLYPLYRRGFLSDQRLRS